jgi:hypothetical protein
MSELRKLGEKREPDIRSGICTWDLGLKYYHLSRETITNDYSQYQIQWNNISQYMRFFK